MSFAVRRLAAGDVAPMEALSTMFGEAFDEVATYCAHRPSTAYRERLLSEQGFIALVALDEQQVVGGLVAYELRKFEQERSEVYIYDLAVSAAHRRRGIATALIAETQDIAAAIGAHVVFIQADVGDEAPIALYTKLGRREEVLHFDLPVKR